MTELLAKPGHRVSIVSLGVAVALIALSIGSLVFFRANKRVVIPENGIVLGVTREQAAERSARFLQETFQQDADAYQGTTIWWTDWTAKTYLEKELGIDRATALADSVDLWGFWTRYVKPGQEEEIQVTVAPDGRIVGYAYFVEDDAPGAHLSREEALQIAERARREITPLPGTWQLVDSSSTEQAARRDWSFSWRRTDLDIPATGPNGRDQGEIRFDAQVMGDQIGNLHLRLQVPEAWQRDYQEMRAANTLTRQVDWYLGLWSLLLAAAVVAVLRFIRDDLRWRTVLVLAVIGGLLQAASVMNNLPGSIGAYDPRTAWGAFVAQIGLSATWQGLWFFCIILAFGAAGEALYRQRFPNHLTLAASFSWRGMTTRSGAVALGLGGLLTSLVLAYQVVYYYAGGFVGFWSPAAILYSNVFSTFVPWLPAATDGYTASIFEEFGFRLFAIPFLTLLFGRVTRRVSAAQWLAIVASATVWGFLHSHYPQNPFYARGIEVGLMGIVWGWLMVRYGILASIAVHFSLDAMYGALPLENGGSTTSVVLAYAIALLPIVLAGVSLARAWLRGGFEEEATLLNGAAGTPAAVQTERPAVVTRTWAYPGLSAGQRRVALGLGAVGLAALLAATFVLRAQPTVGVDARLAGARADAFLVYQGVNPADFQRVVSLERPDMQGDISYLRDHDAAAADRDFFERISPMTFWQVRYFRPLEQDGYLVFVHPTDALGPSPAAFFHVEAEEKAGARLSMDEARSVAQAYLQAKPDWQGVDLTLVDQMSFDRPHRSLYSFTFERSDVHYAEATMRATVQVSGDQVVFYGPIVNVPETWQRSRMSSGISGAASTGIGLLGMALFFCLGGIAFLQLARQRALPIRSGMTVGALVLLVECASIANGWQLLFQNYDTATPLLSFVAQTLALKLVMALVYSLIWGISWSLLLGLWGTEVGQAVPNENRSRWTRETVLLSLGLPLLPLAAVWLVAAIHPDAALLGLDSWLPTGAATPLPLVDALADAEYWGLYVVAWLVTGLLLRRRFGRWWPTVGLGAIAVVWGACQADTLADGALAAAQVAALLLLGAASVRWLARANLAAYLGAALVWTLLLEAVSLLQTTDAWLFANGVALVLIAVAGLAGWLALMDRTRPSEIAPVGASVQEEEGRTTAAAA